MEILNTTRQQPIIPLPLALISPCSSVPMFDCYGTSHEFEAQRVS